MTKKKGVMMTTDVSWQVLPLFTPVGFCLGMLGSLYLAYDLFGRQQKVLRRFVWACSFGFLVASVLLVSYMVLFGPGRLAAGYSPGEIWRTALAVGVLGFLFQNVFFSSLAQVRPPTFFWRKVIFPMVFSSVLLWGLGLSFASHSFIKMVIFVILGVLFIGALNGFSPAIQWWFLNLPERRVAAIGALLIFCTFALLIVQSLCDLMSISF